MRSPTKGAEEARDRHWAASPTMARVVRVAIFVLPIIGAWLIVRIVRDDIYRPDHPLGIVVWAIQAIVVASSTSLLIDRFVSRFLPLASLLGLSLAFPDQAPSRFSMALKTGTIRKLEAHLAEASERGLDADEGVAAKQAIELVTLLGRHERLTRGHTERVRAYTELIAVEMGIDEASRQRLAWAALLHDIGKLTVPSYILNSAGKPSDEEWTILRGHPAAGEAFVEPLADWLGEWRGATSEHHERWDGGGYPRGLAGTEISLAGRIVAAADAYDVITSKRSYKAAMSGEAARTELVRCSGTQFDPDVVRALLKVSVGERKSRSALAWLVELLRLDRVAQAIAIAPAAAAVGIASLGSLIGLSPVGATDAPEQLAFVAPDPSGDPGIQLAFDDDPTTDSTSPRSPVDEVEVPLAAGDGGPASTPSTTPSGSTSTTVAASSPTSLAPAPGQTTIVAPFGTNPVVSTPPVTIPGVTIPGVTTPEISLPGATTTTTIATTSTTAAPTTTTAAPTTTTTTTPPVGPNAANDFHVTLLGLNQNIPVLSNDSPGSSPLNSATLRIVSGPGSGSASVSGGQIRFQTPGLIFLGTSLIYEICDTNAQCDQARVTISL